jgi:hypothetical protein
LAKYQDSVHSKKFSRRLTQKMLAESIAGFFLSRD